MTRNNVEGGRSAKAAGDNFELWIEAQHEKARHLGILAHVEHNQPHSRIVHGRVLYTSAGVADFTGCLERGSAYGYLAVEAKSTKDNRLARSAIEPMQARHLEAVARSGNLALLLVEFRQMGTHIMRVDRFAIPWLEISWKVKRTAESIAAEDLTEWKVAPECYLLKFHPGGKSSSPVRGKVYARE